MSVVGGTPESGLRLDIERPRDGGPPWVYTGQIVTPEGPFGARVTVAAEGAVEIELAEGAPEGAADKARLIVRTAHRHAKDVEPDAPPPRRIQRWRGEK